MALRHAQTQEANRTQRARFVLDNKLPYAVRGSSTPWTFQTRRRPKMATSKRGFASMDAAKQREIASKGGRAAHAKGTAHEFTSDEARVAGRKGGEAVSRDRAHMAAIGREGGHSRGARARAAGTTAAVAVGAAAAGAAITGAVMSHRSDKNDTPGSQPFVRQVNDERSGFENPSGRGSASGGYGSQERSRQDRDRENATDSPISNRDRF
jgi:general stress protein YciG